MTEEEVRAAVRSQGLPAIEDVEAVVLETDGSLSVIRGEDGRESSSLAGISGHDSLRAQPLRTRPGEPRGR
jgi:uncharacterized membrane protein YcaP (DUF421 family)